MKHSGIAGLLICSVATLGLFNTKAAEPDHHEKDHADAKVPTSAVAVLVATKGHNVRGVVRLEQQGQDVVLTGRITKLSPGKHGFHIHEFGDLRARDGSSAGGHYAPDGHPHGAPDADKHHAGDLGNIEANDDGVATIKIRAKDQKLHLLFGRAIVVHDGADDLKSQPSGDAGPRVALGVIGVANPKQQQKKNAGRASAEDSKFSEQVWAYLKKQDYRKNWKRWPEGKEGFTKGESPHGAFLKVYVNETFTNDPADPPLKSMIVKENYDQQKKLVAITPMYRAAKDYAPDHGNWYWAKHKPDGSLFEMKGKPISGKVSGCIECHTGAKGDDYLFTNDK